jgi:CubicO group peptidase (beta-lactamase class C family)
MHRLVLLLPILLLLPDAAPAGAQATDVAPSAPVYGPSDRAECEAFLDAVIQPLMDDELAPGVGVILVKDGEVFLARGWGYANIEKQIPWSVDDTVFPAGSMTKLFTATATMQLVHEGIIDLDADVNDYLDDSIDLPYEPFAQKITVRNLLTHTSGLDTCHMGIAVADEADLMSLETYLQQRMPKRVVPPGFVIRYCDQGYALLGYLVQQRAGIPFAQYLDEHLLQPLGMHDSSGRFPPALLDRMAVGYGSFGDGFYLYPRIIHFHITPATCLLTTVNDVGRFMIAHLNNGVVDGEQLIDPVILEPMHQTQFTSHPTLDAGWAFGFQSRNAKGHHVLDHGGAAVGYFCQIALVPEHDFGLFVVTNAYERRVPKKVMNELLGRYFPAVDPTEEVLPDPTSFEMEYAQIVGSYGMNNEPLATFEKLNGLMNQTRIVDHGDGTITTIAPKSEERWSAIAPYRFTCLDRPAEMVFYRNANGEVTYLLEGVTSQRKLKWYETKTMMTAFFGGLSLIFASSLLLWPIGPAVRRLFRRPPLGARTHLSRLLAAAASGLYVLYLVGFALHLKKEDQSQYLLDPSAAFMALMVVPFIAGVLLATLLVLLIPIWRSDTWNVPAKVHVTLIVLAGIAMYPLLAYWNMLGFHAYN